MRIVIKFAYDGRSFHGFARQPNLRTVEGELIKKLIKNDFIEDATEACLRYSSRTDAGVSALGNVVAFNTNSSEEQIFQKLLGGSTDADILIYGMKVVESDFYPRYAKWRIYRYYLEKNNLELDETLSAASIFIGEHNFSNFARVEANKDPIRTIDNIVLTKEDDFFVIDFYAQTFLWNQVRRVVSAIEKVGIGKLTKKQIIDALDNPNKKVDFGLALPEPLILKDIIYDFEFEYSKNYLEKLEELERRIISSM